MPRRISIFISLLLMVGLVFPVRAQEASFSPILFNLKTATFPEISFLLDVFNPDGKIREGLLEENISILEDEQAIAPTKIEVIDPGMELAVAINPGYSLGILDAQALSRFDKMSANLASWANNLAVDGPLSLNLVTAGGSSAFHLRDPKSWLTSLQAYDPDFKKLLPSSDPLTRAIDITSGSMLPSGARRVVLYITPMADDKDVTSLQSLGSRASQLDVTLFIWIAAGTDAPLTPGFMALKELAETTGGDWFLYSGNEILPDLDNLLNPVRRTYQVTYPSRLTTPGKHRLVVQITTQGGKQETSAVVFDLDVQAPNPILVLPPAEIIRKFDGSGTYEINSLIPKNQNIEAIIEFPDNHKRALKECSLLVNGQVVQTNTTEPFDRFSWSISDYQENEKVLLQVEVVDMLGLRKMSIPIPVEIIVEEIPPWYSILLMNYGDLLLGGAGILAFFGLAGFIIRRLVKKSGSKRKKQTKVADNAESTIKIPAVQKKRSKQAAARLVPYDGGSHGAMATNEIPLAANEIRLGSDPSKTHLVLTDPSISPLHAIINHHETRYTITDQGSTAGTWVNYNDIGTEPCFLKHGDIVHIGQSAYRFVLDQPDEILVVHIEWKSLNR